MTSKRFSEYINKNKRLVEKLRRDYSLSKRDFSEEAQEIKTQIKKIERNMIFAERIRDNIKIYNKLSDIQNMYLIANGINRYCDRSRIENLAVNYLDQSSSTDFVMKKISEATELYKIWGKENKKGFSKFIGKPWAKLFQRGMKEEEYLLLKDDAIIPSNLLVEILTYK